MYKSLILGAMALLFLGCSCPEKAAPAGEKEAATADVTKESLKELADKVNYSFAYDVGKSISRNKMEYNDAIFNKGVVDGMKDGEEGATPLLDDKERLEVKREHAMAQRQVEQSAREEEGKKNKAEADKFMAENKAKEGVQVTESGLQYIVVTEGKGEKPTKEQRVSVHYKGTLLSGEEFDSSYKRNQPATFPVGRVIPGWTEALTMMTVGSKWKLFIPPAIGYGERGAGGKIGPNSALIFEVELLEILEGGAVPPAPAAAVKKIDAMTKIKPTGTVGASAKPAAAKPAAAAPAKPAAAAPAQ